MKPDLLQQLPLAWPLRLHSVLCRLLAWQSFTMSAGRPLLPAHEDAQHTCAFQALPDLAVADAGPFFAQQMLQVSHEAPQLFLDTHTGFKLYTLLCWAGTHSFR